MTESVAWGAVLLAGITAVGTAYNTLQNRLTKRDQLEADTRFAVMESNLANCTERHDDVAGRLDECREEHRKSEEDRSRLWRHVQSLQDWVKAPEVNPAPEVKQIV